MMSLPEVASLLEPRTAELMINLPPETQETFIEGLRLFLGTLEETGLVLDPIERGERLHVLVMRWLEWA